jgi:hypothetical protein
MSSLRYVKRNSLTRLMKWFDHERLEYSVSPSYLAIAPPLFPCRPGSLMSILIDGHLEGLLTEKQAHHGTGRGFTKGRRCTYIF